MKDVEKYISLAEIAYKSGNTARAIVHARAALRHDISPEKAISLRIFIARAYSKIGNFNESNKIYRALLNEKTYLPPVVMGLLYNNFNAKKIGMNLGLLKTWSK